MIDNYKLWIALPIYNEGPSIKILYENLVEILSNNFTNYELVICDDGSDDEGKHYIDSIMSEENCHVIRHTYNRGLAESIRDIFEYIIQNAQSDDLVVRMDGDATHNPVYILDLVKKVSENYDVVVARRITSNDQNLPVIRRLYSVFGRYFVRIFFPLPNLKEYTGGFRCYRVSILKKAFNIYQGSFIQLISFGFVCTFEKLVKLHLIGAKFSEVPFELEYDNKLAESKMVPWITILGYILLVPVIYWPRTGWNTRTKKFRL